MLLQKEQRGLNIPENGWYTLLQCTRYQTTITKPNPKPKYKPIRTALALTLSQSGIRRNLQKVGKLSYCLWNLRGETLQNIDDKNWRFTATTGTACVIGHWGMMRTKLFMSHKVTRYVYVRNARAQPTYGLWPSYGLRYDPPKSHSPYQVCSNPRSYNMTRNILSWGTHSTPPHPTLPHCPAVCGRMWIINIF